MQVDSVQHATVVEHTRTASKRPVHAGRSLSNINQGHTKLKVIDRLAARLSRLGDTHPVSAWPSEAFRLSGTVLGRWWAKVSHLKLYKAPIDQRSVLGRKILMMNPGRVSSQGPITLGDRIRLTTELSEGYIQLHAGSEICNDCRLDFSGGLIIGARTLVSASVCIYTHSHGFDPRSEPVARPLIVGEDVWIGANATIMDSVSHIGKGSIVGAGSVVTRDIPPDEIWAGNPAKKIKSKFESIKQVSPA